ncbi:MAG: AAA family ATPase [bacterium]|nr:AAA family ATPase [bacterium]
MSDREPAHEQAQKAVIGALLLRPQEFHSLKLGLDELTLPVPRRVLEAITDLWDEGITPDVLSIADWTEANKGRALDMMEIEELSRFSSFAWEVPRSVEIVQNAAMDRKCRLIAEGLMKSGKRGPQLLAEAMTAFNGVAGKSQGGAVRLTDAVGELLNEAERREKGEGSSQVLTGIPALDAHQLLPRGGMLTIAGATSMGKSAFMQHLAENWAEQGERILLFSTETQTRKVARRFLAKAGGLNSREFGYGNDSTETWKAMARGASKIHEKAIWVDDENDRSAAMAQEIRKRRQQDGITIVIVDHLQECIENEEPRKEMNQLISTMKSVCREEPKLSLVALSQFTRGIDKRDNRKPRLSDLKESGSIEQTSDVISFVFRPHYYREQVARYAKADPGEMWINVAKAKDGPQGWFGMSWDNTRGQVRGVLERSFNDGPE